MAQFHSCEHQLLSQTGWSIHNDECLIHLMSYYSYHYWQLSNVFLLWVKVSELEMLPKAVTTIIFWVDLLLSNALSLNSVKPISILGISCCCQSCSTLDSVRSWVFLTRWVMKFKTVKVSVCLAKNVSQLYSLLSDIIFLFLFFYNNSPSIKYPWFTWLCRPFTLRNPI